MELKKLYRDLMLLCEREVSLADFLLYADIGARGILARYPKRLVLPKGEYSSPANISDPLMISGEFYTAVLYFAAGSILSDEKLLKKSEEEAKCAYLKLWREAARGKRMRGDKW